MDSLKTIYLLRHAKSDWAAEFRIDHERPISERGRKNAKAVRSLLKDRSLRVYIAYVSDAKRAVYTLEIVSSQNVSVASITLMLLKSPFGVEKKPLSDLWKITEF